MEPRYNEGPGDWQNLLTVMRFFFLYYYWGKENRLLYGGLPYRVFSHDVAAAILMSQNNETEAMLVSQTSPVGVELFSYANAFFCYNKFASLDACHVSENTLYRGSLNRPRSKGADNG